MITSITDPLAVVGIACKYPDANNYHQLWENILSRRRAFRKIPEERLGAVYFSDEAKVRYQKMIWDRGKTKTGYTKDCLSKDG